MLFLKYFSRALGWVRWVDRVVVEARTMLRYFNTGFWYQQKIHQWREKKISRTKKEMWSGRRLDGCWCFCCFRTIAPSHSCRVARLTKFSGELAWLWRNFFSFFVHVCPPVWWLVFLFGPCGCCFMIILWYTTQTQLEIMMKWKFFSFFLAFWGRWIFFFSPHVVLTARTPTANGY